MKIIKCFHCGQSGHLMFECKVRKENKYKKANQIKMQNLKENVHKENVKRVKRNKNQWNYVPRIQNHEQRHKNLNGNLNHALTHKLIEALNEFIRFCQLNKNAKKRKLNVHVFDTGGLQRPFPNAIWLPKARRVD